jgi:hypothetical protein
MVRAFVLICLFCDRIHKTINPARLRSFQRQGDADLYTKAMLFTRDQWKNDPKFMRAVLRLWAALPKIPGQPFLVSEQIYVEFLFLVHHKLGGLFSNFTLLLVNLTFSSFR